MTGFLFVRLASLFLISTVCANEIAFERPIFERCLSGDNFRSLADYILESNHPCDIEFYRGTLVPEKVQYGDIVFVETSGLGVFFLEFYPRIKHPFILISHNHDTSAPREYASYLDDDKIIQWFGFNPTLVHPKFVPLPLGLSNRGWPHSAPHETLINAVLKRRKPGKDLRSIFLYANFSVHTAPKIRKPVYEYFHSIAHTELGRKIVWASGLSFRDFAIDVANSEFVISPPGSGMDCHRVWEALYLGAIPIVIDSSLTPMYSEFPVLIVRDWTDLTVDFLLAKKEELQSKTFHMEKLYFPYWKDRILSLKQSVQSRPR